MQFMLDTDICSYAIMGNAQVLQKMLENSGQYCISAIVYQELMTGLLSSQGQSREALYVEFLRGIKVLPFSQADALHAADIKVSLNKLGAPLATADVQIAAHAASANLTLVSNNTKHFSRISGLSLENWAV